MARRSLRLSLAVALLACIPQAQAYTQTRVSSYTYDALGNLLSRKDASPGVNTQESFSYDSLNRLTLACCRRPKTDPLEAIVPIQN